MTLSVDSGRELNETELRRALDVANIPTLLMVLHHLTGDHAWLREPFLPTRTRGLDLHDTGGLDEDVQRQVRDAAFDALIVWSNGKNIAVEAPEGDLLVTMMSVCMGELVDADYAPMMAEDMGFAPNTVRQPKRGDAERATAIVIGAGVSGLLASMKLTQAGIPHVVLEKNEDVGGTWLNNRYPGCGVDTPSYLYTFSFLPNDWPTYFGRRDDVWNYFSKAADHLNLRDNITFGVAVETADYDATAQQWTVTTCDQAGRRSEYNARFLISAVGQLNVPQTPEFVGADTFAGQQFHSAQWPEDIDLRGKRVAVIGAGASAMQIVPAIVHTVAELTVYQRSPQWVAPSSSYFDRVPDGVHWLMNHVPFYRAWYRFRLAWTFNDKAHAALQIDPEWRHPERSVNAINDGYRGYFERYIRAELDGRPDLIEKALPAYPPYGKRMLLDNGWYRALRSPSVELVTDAVREIAAGGVVAADGTERAADVIVYATGFEARRMIGQYEIRGVDGQSLRDAWGDDNGHAYLGVTVPGFPNLFMMYGPNTNLGHGGSYIWMGEIQIRYIVDLICSMVEEDIATVECSTDVCADYNRKVDAAHDKMVWAHRGMQNWYRNAQGRVVTNSPWRVVDYWRMAHEADLADFICEHDAAQPTGIASSTTNSD